MFTSIIQAREEIVVLLLVELGLPSSERLDETTIPDILRRGPMSQDKPNDIIGKRSKRGLAVRPVK